MNNIKNLGKIFGKRLKKCCKEKRTTQENLKDLLKKYSDDGKTEITVQTVKKWYGGVQLPRLEKFYALCNILDCSSDYLLGIDEERTHDLEFIKQETGLNEKTLTALKKHPNISKSIELLITTEYENQNTDNYFLSLNSVLNELVEYLYTENTTDNPQASALKMLEFQEHLTNLKTLVSQNKRAKYKKLF
jgi:transcriptional regulator with XRE-family HTH domain